MVETQPIGLDNVSQDEGGSDDDENTATIVVNTLTATVDGTDPSSTDINNDFVEARPAISLIKSITAVIDSNTSTSTDA